MKKISVNISPDMQRIIVDILKKLPIENLRRCYAIQTQTTPDEIKKQFPSDKDKDDLIKAINTKADDTFYKALGKDLLKRLNAELKSTLFKKNVYKKIETVKDFLVTLGASPTGEDEEDEDKKKLEQGESHPVAPKQTSTPTNIPVPQTTQTTSTPTASYRLRRISALLSRSMSV